MHPLTVPVHGLVLGPRLRQLAGRGSRLRFGPDEDDAGPIDLRRRRVVGREQRIGVVAVGVRVLPATGCQPALPDCAVRTSAVGHLNHPQHLAEVGKPGIGDRLPHHRIVKVVRTHHAHHPSTTLGRDMEVDEPTRRRTSHRGRADRLQGAGPEAHPGIAGRHERHRFGDRPDRRRHPDHVVGIEVREQHDQRSRQRLTRSHRRQGGRRLVPAATVAAAFEPGDRVKGHGVQLTGPPGGQCGPARRDRRFAGEEVGKSERIQSAVVFLTHRQPP